MLRTYATPLRLDIKSSRIYLTGVAIAVGLAIFSLSILVVDFWLLFSISTFILLISIHICVIKNNSVTVVWKNDNQWKIEADKIQFACLLPSSIVFPWLTILNFKLESGRSKSIMIFPDAICSEQFRQLRVRLKVDSAKIFKKDAKLKV